MEVEAGPKVHASAINFSPASRVTAPDVTDWHLIADHELGSLSEPEAGVIGAIGFAALGAALGALPSGCTAVEKITTNAVVPGEAFRALLILLPATAATVICLIIWGISKWRNKGLVQRIRARPKRPSAQNEVQ